MATVKALFCPECGGKLNLDLDHKLSFCPYCGSQLHFDDGSKTFTINYNENKTITTHDTHVYVDQAAVEREKTKQEKEITRRIREREYEKNKPKDLILGFVILAIICILLVVFGGKA